MLTIIVVNKSIIVKSFIEVVVNIISLKEVKDIALVIVVKILVIVISVIIIAISIRQAIVPF